MQHTLSSKKAKVQSFCDQGSWLLITISHRLQGQNTLDKDFGENHFTVKLPDLQML